MKSELAIAKTQERLRKEFFERKRRKLEGLNRHLEEVQAKIEKLNKEYQLLLTQIEEVEKLPFQDNIPSTEERKRQSENSKVKNSNSF